MQDPSFSPSFFFFFNDTATTEIYTLSHTTLFRSCSVSPAPLRCPRALRSPGGLLVFGIDRKSTRLNSSHGSISYAVFCLHTQQEIAQPPVQEDIAVVAVPDTPHEFCP